jgi:hypothetical protein
MASVGGVAYVLTTSGELLVIDAVEPTATRRDRLLRRLPGLGLADGGERIVALDAYFDPRIGPNPNEFEPIVLVADPAGERLWWIEGDDEADPLRVIDLWEAP